MTSRRLLVGLAVAPLIMGAQNPPAAALPDDTKPVIDRNHPVCKKFPPPVGSRIGPRKICKTMAEWHAIEESDREALDRALRKPCNVPDGAGGCQ